jgi:hypothetical protein
LGCGPAGLFAAQALSMHGFNPVILSKKQKSEIYGAQYLHKPIPGLSSQRPDGQIKTVRRGRPEVYAQRVYGNAQHLTSWHRVEPVVDAWDLRLIYGRAWNKFQENIADVTFGPEDIAELTSEFDLVVSTIPLWSICREPKEHRFNSAAILVKKIPGKSNLNTNWVVYNGTREDQWYRSSSIFGYRSFEARSHPKLLSDSGWESGFKVIDTNCDCHPNIVRAGRMGKWTRGVLTHHAFETTVEAIADQFGAVQPGSWSDQSAGSV